MSITVNAEYRPHPNLRWRYADPDFCHCCGGDTEPVASTTIGRLCLECRKTCQVCGDWMLGGQHECDVMAMMPAPNVVAFPPSHTERERSRGYFWIWIMGMGILELIGLAFWWWRK